MQKDDERPTDTAEIGLSKQDSRIRFLADRVACLMVELVCRDMEYGDFCFDDWFEREDARHRQYYPVCLDFVRRQLSRHDARWAREVAKHEGELEVEPVE